jgi:ABC-type transport system involved in multi-copper enzyme maturation permease subunit
VSATPEIGMESQEPSQVLENAVPLTTRTGSVILGRMDFFSTLVRLIGMECYKIRRSPMSKVLGAVAVALALLVVLTAGMEVAINQNTPARQFVPPCQTQAGGRGQTNCPSLSDMERIKQTVLERLSGPLRLPSALEMAVTQGELNPGIILMIILIGSSAGGELSVGTVRLMFTRGPWRGQFLLAKYGAAVVCAVLGVLGMALFGVIVGQLFNILSGVPQNWHFLNAAWVGHALLYLLATMLNWCMYAVVAIFFGMLGRSTAAGIGGALIWFFAEPIVSTILASAGHFSWGLVGVFLGALPDFLMGNNARALQLNQAHYLFGSASASQSDVQALITVAVYLALFIGLSWWLNESRDVTN